MGFLNRLTNWWNTTGAKVYNGIKNGVSTGYHAVRNIAHKVGDVASGIDNLLNQAKSIPIIGQAAEALQNNHYYKDAQDLVKRGVKTVDDVGEVGAKVGNAIDTAVQKLAPPGN
jgi:hypothetical protein